MSLRKLCYRCKQGDPTGNVWLTEDQQGAGDKGHLLLNYCKRALSPASCRWLMEDQASSSKKVLQAFPEYSSTASSAYLKEWEQPSPCGHQKSKGNFLLEATEEIKCGHWVRALGLLTSQCRGYRTVILLTDLLVTLLVAVTKWLTSSLLRKKGFALAYSLRAQSVTVGTAWQQKHEVGMHF